MESLRLQSSTKKRTIYLLFVFVVLSCYSLKTYSQLPEINVSIDDLVKIQNSPEASAFIQYGNNTVSLYTGIPDISIPIHVIKGRKLSLPISLNYSPGIKVDQIATNVGLGWNLNAGGVVTRNVVGLPDNYSVGTYNTYYSDVYSGLSSMKIKDEFDYFLNNNIAENARYPASSNLVEDYLSFRRLVLDKQIDTQPDSYSFSINGLSGTLYIDYNTSTGYCLEHPDLKVEPIFGTTFISGVKALTGWILTDAQGTIYRFEEPELTKSIEEDIHTSSYTEYNSAWKITQICSFDNTDCISFQYGTPKFYANDQPAQGVTMRRDGPNDNGSTLNCPEGFTQYFGTATYQIKKGFLNSISLNGNLEVQIKYNANERMDLNGTNAVDSIIINNSNNEIVNKIHLKTSYLYAQGGTTEFYYRLMLDEIEIFKEASSKPQHYTFDYFGPNLPERGSYGQDYWGYFNGMVSNQSLIPYNANYTIFQGGANRNPNDAFIRAGTLRRIHFPTGGYTEYSYEMPFTLNPHYENVTTTVGSWSVNGGTDPANAAGYCDNVLTTDPPIGVTGKLTIAVGDEGNYNINVSLLGTNGPNPYQYVALYPDDPTKTTHCDVFQDQTLLFYRNSNISNETVSLWLNAGVYRYMILNDQLGVTLGLSVEKVESVFVTTNDYIGSLRIKKIEEKYSLGKTSRIRYFVYDDVSKLPFADLTRSTFESNNLSSAVLHRPLFFELPTTVQQFDPSGVYFDCTFLNRYASNQATPTPNIVTYSVVSEIEYDSLNDLINGFSVSHFYNDNENLGTDPYKKVHLLNGKLIKKEDFEYNSLLSKNIIMQRDEQQYQTEWLANNWKGIDYKGDGNVHYWDIEIWNDVNDHYYRFAETPIVGFEDPGSQVITVNPTPCALSSNDPNFVECVLPGGSINSSKTSEKYQQYNIGGSAYWVKNVSNIKTTFDPTDSTNKLITILSNQYGSLQHFQVTDIATVDSKNKSVSVKILYPQDVVDQPAAMTAMINQHRIGETVTSQKFYNDDPIPQTEKKTIYNQFNGAYLPAEIQLTNQDSNTQSIQILSYDQFNNIRELIDKDGKRHVYIYGYDGTLPVAHILESNYNEVVQALGGSITFLGPDGKSFSGAQNDLIRANLPNSLVTTYTYKPLVGMTTQTDPNGRTTTYQYDDFGRLSRILDNDGNVLKTYEYHYKN